MASRCLGRVWPNPAVGCVLVRDGRVVGRGWTRPGGRPHAETEALGRAGNAARGATAYVTLEPCSHRGQTPPCAEALVDARIGTVVAAMRDPDPRVSGAGIARLKAAGVSVIEGVCAEEARDLNAGFLSRITRRRPLVTLKLATTLDGRIATHSGHSRWITGDAARGRAHFLRAEHDAVLVGAGTVMADNPELTCRLPGLEDAAPVRVIADGSLSTPLTATLVRHAGELPTWMITREDCDHDRRRILEDNGVEMIVVPRDDAGLPALGAGLEALAGRGITRLLVEGGGKVAASLVRAGLVDRVAWFRAAKVIGGDGLPALAAMGIDRVDRAPRFHRLSVRRVGEDILETLVNRA